MRGQSQMRMRVAQQGMHEGTQRCTAHSGHVQCKVLTRGVMLVPVQVVMRYATRGVQVRVWVVRQRQHGRCVIWVRDQHDLADACVHSQHARHGAIAVIMVPCVHACMAQRRACVMLLGLLAWVSEACVHCLA